MVVHHLSRRASRAKFSHYSSQHEGEGLYVACSPCPPPPPPPPPSSGRPARSSHTRKRPSTYIRRPRNAFFIFRSEFCAQQKMKENGIEHDHRHISRIAAHVWNNLPESRKEVYKRLAQAEDQAHKAAHPSYRYAPIGRPNNMKRRFKRDTREAVVRCRQLAELLISGMVGEDFQQAAKGLNEGIVEVQLTSRTSQPAPRRPRHAHRRPSALEHDASAEMDFKEGSLFSPQNTGPLASRPLPSSVALTAAERDFLGSQSAAAVSLPPAHWELNVPQGTDPILQPAPYSLHSDNFFLTSSDGQAPSAEICLTATSGVAVTAPDLQVFLPPACFPAMQHPLPFPLVSGGATDLSSSASSSFATTIDASALRALSMTPPTQPSSPSGSVGHIEHDAPMEGFIQSGVPISFDSPWRFGANTDVSLGHAADGMSLYYPDQADFYEYFTSV